jgi:hypothetical protein
MAAAYGVPLGGALFALEVLRGMLALRLVLPALLTSVIATATAWLVLPDAPTYVIARFDSSIPNLALAFWSVPSPVWCRSGSCGRSHGPIETGRARWRLVAPVLALGLLGLVSILFPQLLGNGKDIAQLAFADQIPFALLLMLWSSSRPRPCCAWEAASPAACLRRRWRWARCLARPSATPVPSCGPMCNLRWSRSSAPAPCWRPPRKDRSRRWC